MNKDKALKLALEALSATETNCGSRAWEREMEAIALIKEALASPVQEACCYGGIAHDCHAGLGCRIVKKLTATLPAAQQKWVGLTDEEFNEMRKLWLTTKYGSVTKAEVHMFTLAIEAKLKEKNK